MDVTSMSSEVAKRLFEYWNARRRASRWPRRADIDPIEFSYALGKVSLVECVGTPPRFRYNLVSTGLTDQLGYEMTGRFTDDIKEPSVRTNVEKLYRKVWTSGEPFHEIADAVMDGRRWSYELLVLPLSSDGAQVDRLLVFRDALARPVEQEMPATSRLIVTDWEVEHAKQSQLLQLHAAWKQLHRGSRLPSRRDIEPRDLRTLLPYVLLVDVLSAPMDFRFRLVGTHIAEMVGQELTGKPIGEVFPPPFCAEVRYHWTSCVEHKRAKIGSGKLWVPERQYVEWEGIILPLSSDGDRVDMLLAGGVFTLLAAAKSGANPRGNC